MKPRDMGKIRSCLAGFAAVRLAYLYGSSLTRKDFADIDVALRVTPSGKPRRDPIGFRIEVAAALGSLLPREFDVHLLHEMPLALQYRVIATGRCLLARSDLERTRYEAAVLNEFLDFKPAHDFLVRSTLERASRL